MSLAKLWPPASEVDQVVAAVQAEDRSWPLFLAIHQPMKFRKIEFHVGDVRSDGASETILNLTEDDLWKDFSGRLPPGGVKQWIITGQTGVGKSHAICWIQAQFEKHPDREKFHIIRIPKAIGLKRVIERILLGLEGTDYDEIRNELKQARENLDDIGQRHVMQAHFRAAMERQFMQAVDRRSAETMKENDQRVIDHFDATCGFPKLLDHEWFHDVVLERFRKRAEFGPQDFEGKRDVSRPQNLEGKFTPEDFDLQNFGDLGSLPRPVQVYLQKLNAGKVRILLELLDEEAIYDEACSRIMHMDQNALSDLFARIRELLLRDGKELVLLIEDLAALTGIEHALLDIVIRESSDQGKQVLCPMRTALAVTIGHPIKKTVQSRARFEWRIEEVREESEEETLNVTEEFVGKYLNASRIGVAELEKLYESRQDFQVSCRDYADELSDEEIAIVEAFGRSKEGYPLFPFNRATIRGYLDLRCRNSDGKRNFNPRNINTQLLASVLLNGTNAYRNGTFPQSSVIGVEVGLDQSIQTLLVNRFPGQKDRVERYQRFLRLWGDNPHTEEDLKRISEELYRAFSLEPLESFERGSEKPPGTPLDPVTKKEKPPTLPVPKRDQLPPPTPKDPLLSRLQDWRDGKELDRTNSNELRKKLADLTEARYSWGDLLVTPRPVYELNHELIRIPRFGGGPKSGSRSHLEFGQDEDLKDVERSTHLVNGLQALHRLSEDSFGGTHEGCEQDLVNLARFLESIEQSYTVWVREQVSDDDMRQVVAHLFFGARILNLPGAWSEHFVDQLTALFDPAKGFEVRGDDRWSELLREVLGARGNLLNWFFERHGARQGGGSKINAIDPVRIKSWMPKDSDLFPPTGGQAVKEAPKPYQNEIRRVEKSIGTILTDVIGRRDDVLKLLGPDCDLSWTAKGFEIAVEAQRMNLWGAGKSPDDIKKTLEGKWREGLKPAIEALVGLEDTSPRAQLRKLSETDLEALRIGSAKLGEVEKLFSALEGRVAQEGRGAVSDFTNFRTELLETMDHLAAAVATLGNGVSK